jgi:hypothetical protein
MCSDAESRKETGRFGPPLQNLSKTTQDGKRFTPAQAFRHVVGIGFPRKTVLNLAPMLGLVKRPGDRSVADSSTG